MPLQFSTRNLWSNLKKTRLFVHVKYNNINLDMFVLCEKDLVQWKAYPLTVKSSVSKKVALWCGIRNNI